MPVRSIPPAPTEPSGHPAAVASDPDVVRAPYVLLVEDDDGDATLVAEGFRETGQPVLLTRVADGTAALEHLERVATGAAARPDLVLLDLNLPGLSGVEVLRRIKSDPRIASMPVTVLSTSDNPQDIERVYAARGNAYVTKPLDLVAFLDTVARLHRFWVDTARLPGGRP